MNQTKQGFTLIELVLVMGIVASLSVGGLYGWRHWQQQQRLQQNALLLRAWLQQIRDEANATNRDFHIRLTQQNKQWALTACANSGAACSPQSRHIWRPTVPDIWLEGDASNIHFYGLRNTAWAGHLSLGNAGGRWRIIISSWGRIRLCLEGKRAC
ncbi:prepilin peptidase-dependent protein [Apirhabdus apintestini]|uniref:prepilin peptidase-dependent protein n=1 Tax=Erwinia sp. HR93 TaxID=3094840 RepID=UPI002ADEF209|nr:prepilin peptidase-dependent protein [Erwinia sp. HR93]MEA1064120.1 prepilin peptidase-dependent protein [Erwinia sp. HR93]WPM84322.1 prepilin peptidase-dependent protein [Enterobacteriaceae bacterium CA-0114]